MGKQCVKCSYERTDTDIDTPEYECPKCGVIYAKAESSSNNSSMLDESEQEKLKIIKSKSRIKKLKEKSQISHKDTTKKLFLDNISIEHKVGLFGFLSLLLGAFTPLVKMPIVGSISYFYNGDGDGKYIVLLSFITLFFILKNKLTFLWYTGFASLTLIAYSLSNFFLKKYLFLMDQSNSLTNMAINSISIQWGIVFLLIGVLLIFFSAYTNDQRTLMAPSKISIKKRKIIINKRIVKLIIIC